VDVAASRCLVLFVGAPVGAVRCSPIDRLPVSLTSVQAVPGIGGILVYRSRRAARITAALDAASDPGRL
jgi:hypothetical protein